MIQSVCVYCGSSDGRSRGYRDAGYTLGRDIARAGLRLVYGGGTKGVMGAVARGALEAGGGITGVIPRFLTNKEAAGDPSGDLEELVVTEDMHTRKHTMFHKSDAFAALPGGIGTVEELVEVMTWAQLGRHEKPVVLVNVGGFWNPFLKLLDHMRAEGFLHSATRVRPIVVEEAGAAVPAILSAAPDSAEAATGDAAVIERL